MTDDECTEVYQILSAYVSSAGLQWVIDQVDETIILGRLVDVPIRERGFAQGATYELVQISSASNRPLPTSKSKYIQQIQDYTSCERLTMLLDALELAVVRSDDLEQAVFNLLSPNQANISIEFVPERRNDHGFTLSKTETANLTSFRASLFDRLELLRKEINAG